MQETVHVDTSSYVPRERKKVLKLMFAKEEEMTDEGRKHWAKHLRYRLGSKVYKSVKGSRIDAHVTDIDTRDKMGDFTANWMGVGIWHMKGFTGSKRNIGGKKQITLAKIVVKQNPDGSYYARVIPRPTLSRRWWWKG